MDERAAWRILLGQIISDPQEQQRLAQAVGVLPVTLIRWATSTSRPRQESLHLLIKALPHYRQQLVASLQEEFPSFTPADEEKEEEYAEGATLQVLRLSGTGPAARLDCEFAPRLNLLTGDNGLGKTFVLECAWWALTGSWAGYSARPRRDVGVPSMTFQIGNVG